MYSIGLATRVNFPPSAEVDDCHYFRLSRVVHGLSGRFWWLDLALPWAEVAMHLASQARDVLLVESRRQQSVTVI